MAMFEKVDDLNLNLEATELRLGLPGSDNQESEKKNTSTTTTPSSVRGNKRALPTELNEASKSSNASEPQKLGQENSPPTK